MNPFWLTRSTVMGSDMSVNEMISQTTLFAELLPADVSVSLMAHLNVSKFSTASAVMVISFVVQPAVTPRGLAEVRQAHPAPSIAL